MSRKLLYTILTILTIIIFFSVSALCNLCGISGETDKETSGSSTEEEAPEDTLEDQDEIDSIEEAEEDQIDENEETDPGDDDGGAGEEPAEINTPPSIETLIVNDLVIASFEIGAYAGDNLNFLVQALDEDGDTLSYHVQDNIGNVLETAKLDNNNAGFGWVAPEAEGEYILTIIVQDGKGGEDLLNIIVVVEIIDESFISAPMPVYTDLCGHIVKDADVYPGGSMGNILVGDAGMSPDKSVKGYLSFDIRGLSGGTIDSAQLDISGISISGDPTFADNLIIKVFDYGTLDIGDFAVGGSHLATIATSGISSHISITNDSVKNALQEAINANKDYFQLKLGLSTPALDNGTIDGYWIDLSQVIIVYSGR